MKNSGNDIDEVDNIQRRPAALCCKRLNNARTARRSVYPRFPIPSRRTFARFRWSAQRPDGRLAGERLPMAGCRRWSARTFRDRPQCWKSVSLNWITTCSTARCEREVRGDPERKSGLNKLADFLPEELTSLKLQHIQFNVVQHRLLRRL